MMLIESVGQVWKNLVRHIEVSIQQYYYDNKHELLNLQNQPLPNNISCNIYILRQSTHSYPSHQSYILIL